MQQGAYCALATRGSVRESREGTEGGWRPPRRRGIHQDESLCALPTCCGRSPTSEQSREDKPHPDSSVYVGSWMRTSENTPSTRLGE
jgi:hypothetical protein